MIVFFMYVVNGNAKKVVFVVKQYAVRKAKIRPYANQNENAMPTRLPC